MDDSEEQEDLEQAAALLGAATGEPIEVKEKAGVLAERWVKTKDDYESVLKSLQSLVDFANETRGKLARQHGMAVPEMHMPNATINGATGDIHGGVQISTGYTSPVPVSVDEIRTQAALPVAGDQSFASSIAGSMAQISNALKAK